LEEGGFGGLCINEGVEDSVFAPEDGGEGAPSPMKRDRAVVSNLAGLIMKTTLVCVDVAQNHHKIWTGEVLDSGNLLVQWGRIGASLQQKEHLLGSRTIAESKLRSLVSEKQRKGYAVQVSDSSSEVLAFAGFPSQGRILDIMGEIEAQLRRWPAYTAVTFDRATGQLMSPLGVVDRDRLAEATRLFQALQGHTSVEAINLYLRVAPVKVPGSRSAIDMLNSEDGLVQQRVILEMLARCLDLIEEIIGLIEVEMMDLGMGDRAMYLDWGRFEGEGVGVAIDTAKMDAVEW
jgi:predicted DNA-binding WGR domain protein